MTAIRQPRDRFSRKGLTAEMLKTLVRYEPETGEFIRLKAPHRAAGKSLNKPAAQYLNDNGYALISLGRYWRFRAHQLAWLYMTGEWPMTDIDHINDVRHDNRWGNLRAATRSQNIGNARVPCDSLSGVKGASWDKTRGKWASQIVFQGRCIHLGRFDSKAAAGAAYVAASIKYFGEFARVA